jgi:hypothetical protein
MKKDQKIGVAAVSVAVFFIIGLAAGAGKTTPASNTSAIASASALGSAAGLPVAASAPAPSPTVAAVRAASKPKVKAKATVKAKAKAKAKPRRTIIPPATPGPATSKAAAPPPPPPTTTAPVAAPSEPAGCYPLTNGGNCYEPGEYCRESDHGASGVAGDGERIICADNDGWRWEPA